LEVFDMSAFGEDTVKQQAHISLPKRLKLASEQHFMRRLPKRTSLRLSAAFLSGFIAPVVGKN
jgi:hypothetical protein